MAESGEGFQMFSKMTTTQSEQPHIAQLDRAGVFYTQGCGFESCCADQYQPSSMVERSAHNACDAGLIPAADTTNTSELSSLKGTAPFALASSLVNRPSCSIAGVAGFSSEVAS